jgi:hypothetical protein
MRVHVASSGVWNFPPQPRPSLHKVLAYVAQHASGSDGGAALPLPGSFTKGKKRTRPTLLASITLGRDFDMDHIRGFLTAL